MKQNLALFDFDGTISKKDSMIEFLKFYSGKYKLYKAYVTHPFWLIAMYLGIIEKGKVKEKLWVYLLNNASSIEFAKKAEDFSLNILPKLLYDEAMKKIKEHKKIGDRVIVVSASAEDWLKPWCELNHLELLATKLEKFNDRLTGKMTGKNCKGPEKVNRIKEILDINNYNKIYAYGDSSGDKEMLAIANYPFYRKFKD